MTENYRKIFFKASLLNIFLKSKCRNFFSYLLDGRLVSTPLKMRSCCILEGKWQCFETFAEVAEERKQAGLCR